MGLSKMYLLGYNLGCAGGWAYVLFLIATWDQDKSVGSLWSVIGTPLTYVQTVAVLEVVHSLIGLVRSPILTTFMQVASRIIVLWGATILSPAAQAEDWTLTLMAASWCLVEVPRYVNGRSAFVRRLCGARAHVCTCVECMRCVCAGGRAGGRAGAWTPRFPGIWSGPHLETSAGKAHV